MYEGPVSFRSSEILSLFNSGLSEKNLLRLNLLEGLGVEHP
jgi:hypothetical protein